MDDFGREEENSDKKNKEENLGTGETGCTKRRETVQLRKPLQHLVVPAEGTHQNNKITEIVGPSGTRTQNYSCW